MPDGAVRVVLWPEHKTLLPELVTVATGFAFTTTDCATLVAVQPSLVVPVTV